MSYYDILPGAVSGRIAVPPSKSQTLRAVMLGAFARGSTTVRGILRSPDSEAMIGACRTLGADIARSGDELRIAGCGGKIVRTDATIDAGNSGIVLRFVAGLASLGEHPVALTGDDSAQRRPMAAMLDGLGQLGASAVSMRGDGCAPLTIRGPWLRDHACIDGQDSQPVSALLFAAALSGRALHLTVTNPGERPWIEMTLHWLDRLGVSWANEGFESYVVNAGACPASFDYRVPGDLSTAAFPGLAALVTGSALTLDNVDWTDCQGDRRLFELFEAMGASLVIDVSNNSLVVAPGNSFQSIDVDMNDCIDAVPAMAVAACFARGTTRIRNVANARNKECNRLSVLASELRKMGGRLTETDDGLSIEGVGSLHGASVASYNDHRMAMALAVAALGAKGGSTIHGVGCVSKTFPGFVSAMQGVGASIQENL